MAINVGNISTPPLSICTRLAIGVELVGQRLRKIEHSVELTVPSSIHKSRATNWTCSKPVYSCQMTTCIKSANAIAMPSYYSHTSRLPSQTPEIGAMTTRDSAKIKAMLEAWVAHASMCTCAPQIHMPNALGTKYCHACWRRCAHLVTSSGQAKLARTSSARAERTNASMCSAIRPGANRPMMYSQTKALG